MINKRIQNEFYMQSIILDLRVKRSRTRIFMKFFLFLLIFITMASMSSYFVRAYSDPSEKPVVESSNLAPEIKNVEDKKPFKGSSVMSATVVGWYEVNETSNERLDIKTNMQIYVNGKKVSLNK